MFAAKDSWEWILRLNLVSVIDGMRIFVPTMAKQDPGEQCHVVATASIYGLHTGHRPYGTTAPSPLPPPPLPRTPRIPLADMLSHPFASLSSCSRATRRLSVPQPQPSSSMFHPSHPQA